MVSKSVVHKESLEKGQSKKKHRQIAKGCLRYASSIVKDSIDSSQNTFMKKCLKVFGDKIILLHFYVSLYTKKNVSSKFFGFIFLSQHFFSQNFSLSQ